MRIVTKPYKKPTGIRMPPIKGPYRYDREGYMVYGHERTENPNRWDFRLMKTTRMARIWNYYNKGYGFWKISDWPKYVVNMMMENPKGKNELNFLVNFFYGNGVPYIRALVMARTIDVINGRVPKLQPLTDAQGKWYYDTLLRQTRTNRYWVGKKKIWDMEERKWIWL